MVDEKLTQALAEGRRHYAQALQRRADLEIELERCELEIVKLVAVIVNLSALCGETYDDDVVAILSGCHESLRRRERCRRRQARRQVST